jgi:hypothetical protein
VQTWFVQTWFVQTWFVQTWFVQTWFVQTWFVQTWFVQTCVRLASHPPARLLPSLDYFPVIVSSGPVV